MQLEDYFEFLAPDDIRIAGTRVGIETVLDAYVHDGKTAEQIAEAYSSLTLEQVYATILYYLRDKATVGKYLDDYLNYCRNAEEEYDQNPPPGVQRLREESEKLAALSPDERNAALKAMIAKRRKEEERANKRAEVA